MIKYLFTTLLLVISLTVFAQEFKYSGSVYGTDEIGVQNVPISLYTKRIVPYLITYPTYPSSISYNTGTAISSSDDIVTGPYNIGFNFTFFGVSYSQFYVCSNGWIGFSSGQTNGYTAAYLPNSSSPLNCILADWEDLYPGTSNIYYTTTGTAPNRKLIVSFYNCPHYSCRSTLYTFQFVLYETSNVIDINMLSKPLCSGYAATQGLVNTTYTNVVPVGGKNASNWSVSNYSVRFTPSAVESAFSFNSTYNTDATGKYTINSGLDINDYQFQINIDALTISTPTIADARAATTTVLTNASLTTKAYYLKDVNGDNKVTISDVFCIYARIAGRFTSWPSSAPNYRLFTSTVWNTIKNGSTDTRTTYPGTQTISISSPTNGGTTDFYLIRTGFAN